MNNSNKISIVIPVYNSNSTLIELHSRLSEALEKLRMEYEIIFVDDCSKDSSWIYLNKIRDNDDHIKIIQLMRNYGQHNALLAGIRLAQNNVIITMDDDLQNPPEEIPKLLEKLSDEFDVVYGIPLSQQHGFWRNIASKITKLALQSVMGAEIARNISTFRVFRSQVRDAFINYNGPFVNIDVLLTWGTFRFGAVPVQHDARIEGLSNYTFGKLLSHAVNMMTGFGTVPLKIATMVGFFFTLFGLGVLGFVIVRYFLEGGSVPGFPFLASIIAIFSGVQLFCLGMIGEYLIRMHFRLMGQPTYTIRNSL